MNVRSDLASLALAIGFAVVAAICRAETATRNSKTTFMRDALQKYIDSGEFPGAISVLYKDGIQETACLGYSDVRTKRPITLDSFFMQCSQTKGFCGVTVAQLVEEGKIALDDPVSKYLPEFKSLWVTVATTNDTRVTKKAKNVLTVRMCLNHTGGFPFELPNAVAMGGWSRRMPLRSVAATAAAQPLLFEPGTDVRYSNVGIDIGAAVVEAVTHKRWERVVQERILDPLGMKSTTFFPTDEQLATKIELYKVKKGQPAKWIDHADWMQPPYGDDRVFASAGAGLWTTARDQLKFYKMLMNLGVGENGARILKKETVKNLLAVSSRSPDLKDPRYSLGLEAPVKDHANCSFGHGGAWGTFGMVNWHKKQLRLWVVQLRGDGPWNADRIKATSQFFDAKIDSSGAGAYVGRLQ